MNHKSDSNNAPHWADAWWAICIAWIFLSKVPAPRIQRFNERVMGRSLYAYPLIGLLLAGFLLTIASLSQLLALPSLLSAVIIVVAWIWLTGALHLDGLADTADAMAAAHAQPERALAVMKDPTIGAIGAVVVFCQILVKVGLVAALLDWWQGYEIKHGESNTYLLLYLPCVVILARLSPHWQLQQGHYLNPKGLAHSLVQYATAPSLYLLISIVVASLLIAGIALQLAISHLLGLLGIILASWWLVNLVWLKRSQRLFGGHTGDTLGLSIELSESILLLVITIVCYSA